MLHYHYASLAKHSGAFAIQPCGTLGNAAFHLTGKSNLNT